MHRTQQTSADSLLLLLASTVNTYTSIIVCTLQTNLHSIHASQPACGSSDSRDFPYTMQQIQQACQESLDVNLLSTSLPMARLTVSVVVTACKRSSASYSSLLALLA